MDVEKSADELIKKGEEGGGVSIQSPVRDIFGISKSF